MKWQIIGYVPVFFQVDTKFYLDARLPADSCLPLTIVREARSEHFASCDDDAKYFHDIDEQIDGAFDDKFHLGVLNCFE